MNNKYAKHSYFEQYAYVINYFITDHLGSTRVITDNTGSIKEQNDYYPFGMRHSNANLMLSANRWQFNGKEKQTTANINYMDYGARMYDDFTSRWFVQDPLQEKYYPFSSYAYCVNNPINAIDPDGRFPIVLAVPWLVGIGKALFTAAGATTVVLAASTLKGDTSHREKEDKRREGKSREEDANTARNHNDMVDKNVGKVSPDGTPDPKGGGSLAAKIITSLGLGGAAYQSIIEPLNSEQNEPNNQQNENKNEAAQSEQSQQDTQKTETEYSKQEVDDINKNINLPIKLSVP